MPSKNKWTRARTATTDKQKRQRCDDGCCWRMLAQTQSRKSANYIGPTLKNVDYILYSYHIHVSSCRHRRRYKSNKPYYSHVKCDKLCGFAEVHQPTSTVIVVVVVVDQYVALLRRWVIVGKKNERERERRLEWEIKLTESSSTNNNSVEHIKCTVWTKNICGNTLRCFANVNNFFFQTTNFLIQSYH